jgi:hypothetical protein
MSAVGWKAVIDRMTSDIHPGPVSRLLFACLALIAASPALSRNALALSAAELAKAIGQHTHKTVNPIDIKPSMCQPMEEPTEFECSWRQRSGPRWRKYRTYFAVDGKNGWVIIDWPPSSVR